MAPTRVLSANTTATRNSTGGDSATLAAATALPPSAIGSPSWVQQRLVASVMFFFSCLLAV